MNILIRCDGSPEIGLGHVVRCMALADVLKKEHGGSVTFAMRRSALGVDLVRKAYPVLTPHVDNEKFHYETWLKDVVRFTGSKVLILDVRDGLSLKALEMIKKKNVLVVDIDDPEKKRIAADLVFYPPVTSVMSMDWKHFSGRIYSGWDWVILREDFMDSSRKIPVRKNGVPNILVTMGGSDPRRMTFKAINALKRLQNRSFAVSVVIGSGFQDRQGLGKLLSECSFPVQVFENVRKMACLMKTMDLAVCSFGVTAYELAACGVPAIHLCLSADHARASEIFVRSGIAVGAGVYNRVSAVALAGSIDALLDAPEKRKRMERKTQKLMGRGGARNIAETIVSALSLHHRAA